MRSVRALLVTLIAAGTFVVGAQAVAQTPNPADFTDLPGLENLREQVRARIASRVPAGLSPAIDRALRDAGASGLLPTAADLANNGANGLQPAVASPQPAAAPATRPSSSGGGRELPSTGADVLGYALLGVAMISGGRLLLELVRGRRLQTAA